MSIEIHYTKYILQGIMGVPAAVQAYSSLTKSVQM